MRCYAYHYPIHKNRFRFATTYSIEIQTIFEFRFYNGLAKENLRHQIYKINRNLSLPDFLLKTRVSTILFKQISSDCVKILKQILGGNPPDPPFEKARYARNHAPLAIAMPPLDKKSWRRACTALAVPAVPLVPPLHSIVGKLKIRQSGLSILATIHSIVGKLKIS